MKVEGAKIEVHHDAESVGLPLEGFDLVVVEPLYVFVGNDLFEIIE